MKWTKDLPTEPGYYWVRMKNFIDPILMDMRHFDVCEAGGYMVRHHLTWFTFKSGRGARFAGPLRPPEEE